LVLRFDFRCLWCYRDFRNKTRIFFVVSCAASSFGDQSRCCSSEKRILTPVNRCRHAGAVDQWIRTVHHHIRLPKNAPSQGTKTGSDGEVAMHVDGEEYATRVSGLGVQCGGVFPFTKEATETPLRRPDSSHDGFDMLVPDLFLLLTPHPEI